MSKYVLLSFDLKNASSSDYANVYKKMKAEKWTKGGPSTNMHASFEDSVSNANCIKTSANDLKTASRQAGATLDEYVIAVCAEKPTFG